MTKQYLVFSDVHFGHRRTPTNVIIEHINQMFEDNKNFADIDALFIAGDLFHTKLELPSHDGSLVIMFMLNLANFCAKNKITLRLLEGTASHDWKQGRIIEEVIKGSNINVDFKYIQTITIENIESLGKNVLFLPDNWEPKEAMDAIDKLMKEKQLSKVDLTIMHGQFPYQLPMIDSIHSYPETYFLNITKGLIHPGHIHTHSVFDRIIAQGSIDRISHGEEEDKGLLLVSIDGNSYQWKFIKNKHAKMFKTIKIKNNDIDKIKSSIRKAVKVFRKKDYLKIKVGPDSIIPNIIFDLRQEFIGINIDYELDNKSKRSSPQLQSLVSIEDKDPEEIVTITEDNIVDLISRRLTEQYTKDQIKDELNELI